MTYLLLGRVSNYDVFGAYKQKHQADLSQLSSEKYDLEINTLFDMFTRQYIYMLLLSAAVHLQAWLC